MKEAAARVKINRLLEASGWRFFKDERGPANIQLEPRVALTKRALDDLGEDFEEASPPSLIIQKAIVSEIEAEQTLVAANRDLIARFEKKIQTTLTRVWGEEEPITEDAAQDSDDAKGTRRATH